MKVTALKPHNPSGRKAYTTGDTYHLSEREAKLMAELGFVKIEDEPSQKRTYKRRDMVAQKP